MTMAGKKHHPQLIKRDFHRCLVEKGSGGLRNEAACLCHRVYDQNRMNSWASAGSAEVWTFSYCFTFTSWRRGTSCRQEQEADVPPNLIWFDGRFSFFNTEHLARISPYAYCSVKPLCNPFSAVMIPQIRLFGLMSICSLPLFR